MPINDRPRERLLKVGKENITDEELLAILIKNGTRNYSVKDISNTILSRLNNISDLDDINVYSLNNIKGLGIVKITELLAAIELGRRIYLRNNQKKIIIYLCADTIFYDNRYLFFGKKQEYFYCLYLDNKNKLIERKLLFMGTINRSIVHPREIFKEAYLVSACKFVCLHNHPSGDITPSEEDLHLTKSLIEIGKLQGINMMDHLIIGNTKYYSFYDHHKELF